MLPTLSAAQDGATSPPVEVTVPEDGTREGPQLEVRMFKNTQVLDRIRFAVMVAAAAGAATVLAQQPQSIFCEPAP